MNDLAALYRNRFSEADLPGKRRIWEVLCRDFFQQYVSPDDSVLDIAAGYGEFINNIRSGRKFAVDLNPDTTEFLDDDVTFHQTAADQLTAFPDNVLDVVFTSNFLEHLPDKAALSRVFAEINRVLRPGGKVLIMGPNIRCIPGAYWDFFDHTLALSHATVAEGLLLHGFALDRVVDRFLPYTTRTALPQHPLLVSLYLKFPLAWKILGAQFFIVGHKELAAAQAAPLSSRVADVISSQE